MKKNKLRISKTVAKRIKKVTKSGKIIVSRASSQHLASNKSKRRRQSSKRDMVMSAGDVNNYKNILK